MQLNSGYKLHELLVAKIKALSLDRTVLIGIDEQESIGIPTTKDEDSKTINFVINVQKSLTAIIKARQEDINNLVVVGDTRVIFSEKVIDLVSNYYLQSHRSPSP